MRYLGIDYGAKKIGIAISDDKGGFAFPRDTLENNEKSIDRIAEIVEAENIGGVVMGDTRSLSGESNRITESADAYAFRLQAFLKVPVHRVREAWSSQEAARFAPPGKRHDDSSAAAIILQRFLDAQAKTE